MAALRVDRFLVGILTLCAFLPIPARAQPFGLDHRATVGPFLDHRLPSSGPSPGWTPVIAFPGLLFTNAVGLVPVPGTTNVLCVWEREGRIWTFTNSIRTTEMRLVADLSRQCQGWDDSGLLGLAFHPGFPTNHYLFVFYKWVTPGAVIGSPTERPSPARPSRNRLSRLTLHRRYGVRQEF